MRTHERRGFALLLVVAALLAGGALALLVATLAAERVRLVRARAELLRARMAAVSVAADGLRAWSRALIGGLAPGVETPLITSPSGRATIERLAPSGFLVRGYGTVRVPGAGSGAARAGVALLVTGVDVAELTAAFDAAMTVDSGTTAVVAAGGTIEGPVRVDSAALLELEDASAIGSPLAGPLPRLPLSPASIAAIGSDGVGAAPIVLSDSLAIAGSLSGVIVVTGALVLRSGARVEGVVLVSGELIVESGAEIVGAVRLTDGARLRVDGRVTADAAVVQAAVDTSSIPDVPFRVGPRLWLPIY